MNEFEKIIGDQGLWSSDIGIIQVNLGLRCNQSCSHCHVDASPVRAESMEWQVMEQTVKACRNTCCSMVDITGGAPELNPFFRRFVAMLHDEGIPAQVRTNLTALSEPGMEDLPLFFRDKHVRLVASMPCYLEENVRVQRGAGAYEKSIAGIRRLNELGYGIDKDLALDLVYNPGGPFLPPDQTWLEEEFRKELHSRFGIFFTRLLTLTNMPVGRFLDVLKLNGMEAKYMYLLKGAFNPRTVEGLMCRHQISVGWDGTLYDCDFNLALKMPVDHGKPNHVSSFDNESLAQRRIVLGNHCFGCTAGHGSSCSGAIA